MDINSFTKHFPPLLTEKLLLAGTKTLQEIRIMADKSCVIQKNGILTDLQITLDKAQISKIVESMCHGSMYAVQTSLVEGYITLKDGHRVGVCGKGVIKDGQITHLTDISGICIRIAREVKGAADEIIEYLKYNEKLYNTLIVSPPGCGKTTVLRDAARQLGNTHKVCIADERSEIASGGFGGNFDVGKFTCVMDAVPKAKAMMMLLRTMSPEIIITDETGKEEEQKAILEIINSGVKIITTAHGYSEYDIERKKHLGDMVKSGIFERIIVLSGRNGPGTVEKIITDGRVLRRV